MHQYGAGSIRNNVRREPIQNQVVQLIDAPLPIVDAPKHVLAGQISFRRGKLFCDIRHRPLA